MTQLFVIMKSRHEEHGVYPNSLFLTRTLLCSHSLGVRSKHLMSAFPTLRHIPSSDPLLISAQLNHGFVAIILDDFIHAKFHPDREHQPLCAERCRSTTGQEGL